MYNHLKKHLPSVSLTLSPRETALCFTACALGAAACTMTGVVLGMLISPRKTIAIGSNNGNHNGNNNNSPAGAPEAGEKEEA